MSNCRLSEVNVDYLCIDANLIFAFVVIIFFEGWTLGGLTPPPRTWVIDLAGESETSVMKFLPDWIESENMLDAK